MTISIFVPIKSKSERVPRKNFRDFGGKPLYQYVLSKYFSNDVNFFVDTDSEEIFNWVNDCCPNNFKAYMRDDNLIGNDVSVNLLIKNFLIKHDTDDIIVQIHVTSPFLTPDIVLQSAGLINENFDSVASANIIQSRLWRMENYGWCPINHNPTKMEKTQDLVNVYEENSALYAFRRNSFMDSGRRISDKHTFVDIGFPYNLDIDNEKDWEFCSKVLKIFKEN